MHSSRLKLLLSRTEVVMSIIKYGYMFWSSGAHGKLRLPRVSPEMEPTQMLLQLRQKSQYP